MAISKTTLAAIQKTGAAVHNLKLSLRTEVKKYSDRLSKALSSNVDGNVFDLLEGTEISTWKSVGQLSKMVEAIEADLVTAYKYATDLVSGPKQTVAKTPKASKTKAKTATANKAAPKAKAKTSAHQGASNPEKLLAQLNTVLSSDTFSALNQTELTKATGIPMGSISAAIKKLTETGAIVKGPDGSFKLAKKVAASAPQSAPAAKTPSSKAAKKSAAKKAPKKTSVKKAATVIAPNADAAQSEPAVAVAVPETQASAS
jgi:ribosomal protein S25